MGIRPARFADLPQLKRIITIHHQLLTEATEAGICHVAEEASQLQGFVILEQSFYAYGFISLLFVHEEHRRVGVATSLMTHAEGLCTTPKLFTSTNESNVPMQRLCDRLGYEPSGVIYNLDEDDPELVYMKRLQ